MKLLRQLNSVCLLTAIFFLSACSVQKEVVLTPGPSVQVEFETIGKGSLYGAGEEGIEESNTLIRSNDEWEALKNKMDAVNTVSQNFKEHEVNFAEYYLIACFDPVRPNGGYSMRIRDIVATQHQLEVLIERPEPKGMAISVLIQPYHIIRIPKTDKEILFLSLN